jgi:hypothetical protein
VEPYQWNMERGIEQCNPVVDRCPYTSCCASRLTVICKGACIVQADSVSDSDSENQNKNEEIFPVSRLTQTVCTDPPAPATIIRTHTVKKRTFFAPTGADSQTWSPNLNLPALPTGADSQNRSRNLNLPALYASPKSLVY